MKLCLLHAVLTAAILARWFTHWPHSFFDSAARGLGAAVRREMDRRAQPGRAA